MVLLPCRRKNDRAVTLQGTSDRETWCGGLNPFSTMSTAELDSLEVDTYDDDIVETKENETSVEVAQDNKPVDAFMNADDGPDVANAQDGDVVKLLTPIGDG